jgi:hypothetical protein
MTTMHMKPNIEVDIPNAVALDYKDLPGEEVKRSPAWRPLLEGLLN